MPDFPHVRSTDVCPLCHRQKDFGLIVCWPCYCDWGMRYGSDEAEELIRQDEIRLSETVEETDPGQ